MLGKESHHFLAHAITLSYDNVLTGKGGPFGAVVVKDGQIIAQGVNQVTALNDPTAHAEVMAIRNACAALNSFQLTGCIIYSSCEPCPMCLGALYWARPDAVFFANTRQDAAAIGFDDNFIYEQIAIPGDQRTIPTIHIPEPTALKAFEAWRELSHKKVY